MIRINRNPSQRQLALFGLAWLVFFGVVGTLLLRAGGSSFLIAAIWTIAALVPGIGWARPALMRRVYVASVYAAFPVGWVVSHVILAAIYYLLLTPMGWLLRLAGYDPMARRFEREAKTYWVETEDPDEPERYFKQY